MFCPKCKIEVGEDQFCGKCGEVTVASDEIVSTTEDQAPVSKPIQGDNMRKKIKVTVPKSTSKKIIWLVAFIVILIGGFIGYKVLQSKNTPQAAVNQYYTYLANKDYDNAYKMLYNTDNDFMSEDMFKKSVSNLNFKNYIIKDFNKDEFNSTNDINSNDTTYEVQANGVSYVAEVEQSGKKDFIFNGYKINAKNFITKNWSFDVPHKAEIYVNGIKVNNLVTDGAENSITSQSSFTGEDGVYKTRTDTYQINSIFTGKYTVKMQLQGATDIKIKDVPVGRKVDADFKISKVIKQQLQSQAKEFLKAYYGKKDMSEFLSSDSDVQTGIKESENVKSSAKIDIKSRGVMHDDLTLQAESLDDSTHANITVEYTTDAPAQVISGVIVSEKKQEIVNKTIYFEKVGNKWLICSADI